MKKNTDGYIHTCIRENGTASIISGSYIRDEHKKIIGDFEL